jgi:hypothetical protein
MARIYTTQLQVLIDSMMWASAFHKQQYHLALLPAIAAQRWQWFVDNWGDIYKQFKALAAGDEKNETSLVDFDSSIQSYRLGNNINILQDSDNIAKFWFFLSSIMITELVLTPEETTLIDLETQRITNFTIEAFRDMLRFIREDAYLRAGSIGLGDADAARILGLQVPTRQRSATISDLDLIGDVNELYKFVESIAYLYKRTVDRPPNLLTIANQNISGESNVAINAAYLSYRSVPFEISLESMAAKQLGDARLWFELVTVNNLQPPYVDEAGERYLLLSPGASNNIIISSERRNDIHVGAKIGIGSYKVKEEARIIEKITYNSDNTMVLFLSGAVDLVKLKTSEAAFVRIYKPHTVNSGSFILIPSSLPTANLPTTTPGSDALRRLDAPLLKFGVDLARSPTGDISIDANGNLAMAAGLQNVRQAVLYHLKTTAGDLPFHPTFGINAAIGERYYGTRDEVMIFAQLLSDAVMTDPRFTGVMIQDIKATNTGMSITFLAQIAGLDAQIPLSFVS